MSATLYPVSMSAASPQFTDPQFTGPEITPQDFARIRSRASQTATPKEEKEDRGGPVSDLPDSEAPILLDVREPWELQTASLGGSLPMPMGDVPSRAHAELDPDAHIVVLCHHGQRSLSVAMWLRGQGFERAQSLAGGIDAWSRVIDATVPRY
jgi:rhodanese-related sulfurtransferase